MDSGFRVEDRVYTGPSFAVVVLSTTQSTRKRRNLFIRKHAGGSCQSGKALVFLWMAELCGL